MIVTSFYHVGRQSASQLSYRFLQTVFPMTGLYCHAAANGYRITGTFAERNLQVNVMKTVEMCM